MNCRPNLKVTMKCDPPEGWVRSAECRLRHEAARGGRDVWHRVGGARVTKGARTSVRLFYIDSFELQHAH